MTKFYLSLLLAATIGLAAHAQTDSAQLKTITTSVQRLAGRRPVEKVYLHLNQERYNPGDTIWIKGYVTVGAKHQPSALSGVLYVDLIDSRETLIKSIKLKNFNGLSTGYIALTNNLLPGVYRIRAYTAWMRNFGDDTFFEQAIQVNGNSGGTSVATTTAMSPGSSASPTSSTTQTSPANIDIQFLPEGGKLINGVRSKLAFKAVGTNGLGVDVSGTVVDNDNQTVAEFKSQHLGMGVFAILPQTGKTYTAKINGASVTLPKAEDKGFVLTINNNPQDTSKLNIRITTNAATIAERNGQSFYLVGQTNGQVYVAAPGKFNSDAIVVSVSKASFPTGIAQFTLFSKDGEPINERVVFINNPDDRMNLSIGGIRSSYKIKEGTDISLAAKDSKQQPIQGSFSVAVYRDDNNSNNESSILTHLLLTSDLKGYIEQPGYYFNAGHQADLDNLLLTQGYRSFVWKDIINNKYVAMTYKPEKALTLSGVLTDTKGKPVAAGKVFAYSVTDRISTAEATTDEDGKFTIEGINAIDYVNLTVQGKKSDMDRDVKIKLNGVGAMPAMALTNSNAMIAEFQSDQPGAANAAPGAARAVNNANNPAPTTGRLKDKTDTLKEVLVNRQRNNAGTPNAPWMGKASMHSANLNGPGHADMIMSSEQIGTCVDLISCVINKIPGVGIKTINTPGGAVIDGIFYDYNDDLYYFFRHQGQSLTGVSGKNGQKYPIPIRFMLDGQFASFDNLRNVVATQVESVEVLESTNYLNIYGTSGSGGLILITTKNGVDDVNKKSLVSNDGMIKTEFYGFDRPKEFYVPKYAPKSNVPDNRTAVYWNPNIATDANGAFTSQFYNSDVKGSYKVVVEGIDDNGDLGRAVYRYKVQ